MNSPPSNILEEEAYQDAVQITDDYGPGSEHWLLEQPDNVFDANTQTPHRSDDQQETQEEFHRFLDINQDFQQEESEDPQAENFNVNEWNEECWEQTECQRDNQCVQHGCVPTQQDARASQSQNQQSFERSEEQHNYEWGNQQDCEEHCDC